MASGRFGVTADYLNHCEELEIKIAQGAKPGEGGQLPGIKVTELIAKLRHSTPGVSLISPPPHHDIYSIEDLAQLIYDLKQINPRAKVCVKLVSQSGVGTIAAGVAKAKADVILISGHNGGTGASPQTSIKFAGLPWEMGLSEAHQVLTINNLRERVILRTDGGLRTGRDIVIAAMLGAQEFGIGTAALIAMGCIMVRQCQCNTCPVGVCTQDPALREKFTGTADKVVNLMSFYAQEVREVLASVGARSIDEVIGRADLLTQVSRGAEHLDDLDLNPLLIRVDQGEPIDYDRRKPRNTVPDTLDAQVVQRRRAVLQGRREDAAQLRGAEHAALDRHAGVEPYRAAVRDEGERAAARPSDDQARRLGRAVARGVRGAGAEDRGDGRGERLRRQGAVGRHHRGAAAARLARWCRTRTRSSATPCSTARRRARCSPAAGPASGSACATPGAEVVVEGCGSNGCEYMTGGVAVILGRFGDNFGAGMTGGMAYLYDPDAEHTLRLNGETVIVVPVLGQHWEAQLKGLIERHHRETASPRAAEILRHWDEELPRFRQIVPKEMLNRLAHPLSDRVEAATA